MFKLLKRLICSCAIFLMAISLISCGGGGSGASTGTLGIGLTDATTDQYQAIYVTIDEVQVKKQGDAEGEAGWLTVLTPEQTFNLLELVNGVIADLGLAELEAGEYGQMRLILGTQADDSENILGETHQYPNYLIKNDTENTIEELKVPSGYQTGIKIVKGFTIEANGFTELILDFDALKSVVQAGNSGQWLLKPTIKVIDTVRYAVVSGIVDTIEEDTSVPVNGALVNAQIYTPPPEPLDGWDPKDEVTNEGGTASDETGAYTLNLSLDTYNIVATMAGYGPQCQVVAATDYLDYLADFTLSALTAEDSGTFTGSVTGVATAEFSIRLMHDDCGMIEVAWVAVADGATSDTITLPVGTYEVVVSPEGESTYIESIDILVGENTDVAYPPPSP